MEVESIEKYDPHKLRFSLQIPFSHPEKTVLTLSPTLSTSNLKLSHHFNTPL